LKKIQKYYLRNNVKASRAIEQCHY